MEPRFFPTSYLLDAFLRLDEKGVVKPGESKKGLEMGILGPTGDSSWNQSHPTKWALTRHGDVRALR